MVMLDEKQKEYIKNISCTKEEYREQVKNDLMKDRMWAQMLYVIICVWGDNNKPVLIDEMADLITEMVWSMKDEL